MVSFGQDLRYAIRLLLRTPAVTSVAILSLSLGIGANTAIFGVINALLLRSLPVRDPYQLVGIAAVDPEHPEHGGSISLAMFEEIRRRTTVFTDVFVWSAGGMRNIEMNGARYAGAVDGVSADYFATLGVKPALGRLLTREDVPLNGRSSMQVAVLSYGAWRQRFAGDMHVLGKIMRVDDIPVTIVGVAPSQFRGLDIDTEPAATIPIGYSQRKLKYRENLWYRCFGRLRTGVTLTQARAQITSVWPNILRSTVPDSWAGAQRSQFLSLCAEVAAAAHGTSYLREQIEKPVAILMTLVAAVLLIACVNLANLLLARAAARQHEFGVRLALGSGRWLLFRLLLVEALLLSCSGAVLGLLIAHSAASYLLASVWNGYVPLRLDPSPDARVVAFTAALAILTTLLFGTFPAWITSRSDPTKLLGRSERITGGRNGRFRRCLIAAQIALSLVLLIGATLFVRSLENLRSVNLGYRRDHLLLVQLYPQPGHDKIPNRVAYFHQLTDRISQLPGVASVSYLHMGPTSDFEYKSPVSTPGGGVTNAVEEWAGPGFFEMIGMQVLSGREFTWRDNEHAPRVAVISESLARTLFPTRNAIGQVINIGAEPGHQGLRIVGVVNSAALWKFDDKQQLAVYHALMQEPTYNESRLLIRTSLDPMSLAHSVEQKLESLGYQYSLRTQSIDQWTDQALVLQRMIALLASGFSLLALLLASVGLYGLMSYAVTGRSAEIGVRMALGAKRSDVLRMVLGEAVLLISIGVLIAIPIALACGKFVSALLFGVTASDPVTILTACSTLIVVAMFAGLIPALRAASVDAIFALRHE